MQSRLIFARSLYAVFFALLFALGFSAPTAAQTVSVLTQHNDAQRSGANLNETILNTSNVSAVQFGKIFMRTLDGHLYAQPLYVPNVTIQGQTHNVIYVATAHNTVYAFDADDPAQSAPLWSVSLGPSVPSSVINTPNILVEVGIIATPVIALTTNASGVNSGTIYVTAKTLENNVQIWRLHALDITTGAPVNGSPVQISATVPGTAEGGTTVTFTASQQNQRPGLLLLNGVVYLGFASHEDYAPYHGWVFGYNASNLQAAPSVFITTPNGGYGGIWQGGQGLIGDVAGNVYCMVGNGQPNADPNSAASNGKDYGEGFLKLTPSGSNLNITDWFLPNNWASLDASDADMGSGGPLLLPGTHYLVGGGKQGIFYVVDTTNMGHYQAGSDSQIVQSFQGWNGEYRGGFAYWNSPNLGPLVYVWGGSDVGKAYAFSNGFFGTTPATQTNNVLSYGASNSPGMSVSANGSAAGTGILWAAMSASGDSDHATVPGVLRAFDASNLSVELWNSNQSPADALGNWAKFDPPTIANGKVYAPTDSGQLVVYGLLPHTPPDAPTALVASAGNALVALRWTNPGRAASFNVKRSLTQGGPYTTLASNITTAYYNDLTAANGTTYYYVVSAVNPYGESANSNEDSATPNASNVGGSIGLNFVGGGTAMGADEVAGVIPVSNWNNLTDASGSVGQIADNFGLPTPTSIAYSCAGVWQIGLADMPGDFRMMNGYLDSTDTSVTTVTVSGLPGSFLSSGYDVYVYCNGDGNGRVGDYTIGAATIIAQDNATFNGTYIQANNSTGNYVVFTNVNANSFTLSAQADQATGGFRAPVNAIQIVAHNSTLPAPTGLIALAGNGAVTLNWNPVAGAASYKVKRSATQGGPYSIINSLVTGTNYVDSAVTNGTTYYYVVAAVDSKGALSSNSNEASATPNAPDFGLTVNPASVSVARGSNAQVTVSAFSLGGFSGNATLSASGLPSQVTASFNPGTVATGSQSVLTLTASSSAPLGAKTVTITGVNGGVSHTVTFTLTVVNPANAGNGIFGINFQGGRTGGPADTPMGAGEIAGVFPTSNWNNGSGQSGTLSNLHDSGNGATTVAVTWNANNTWDSGITDAPGNSRMMKGYLDTNSAVTVSGLDPAQTYQVYVYADGDGTDGRVGMYTIGSETYYFTDTSNFDGSTFTQITSTDPNNPGSGNYMRFTVTAQANFTLNATAFAGATPRAPVNGIQIVQSRAISGVITLEGAANPAQPLTFLFRDFTTGNLLFSRTQTLTPIAGTSNGTFQFTGIPAAKYNLAIKGAINLQKVVSVDASAGNVSNVAATLPAGDANGDNSVDATDFGIFVGAYNSDSSVPGSGYDARADFNFDGVVDPTDFGLFVGNYNTQGDN